MDLKTPIKPRRSSSSSSVSCLTPFLRFSSASASSKRFAATPSTTSPYIWISRRYESYAKRAFSVARASPSTAWSFRPRLRIVSIIPGIETAAPGIVLAGWSAGAICWFEAAVTDSFGPQLAAMKCLGFLAGSACPHYDGEELRRPRYAELLAEGLPPGIAIDDDAGVRFDGTELTEVVTSRAGAGAYRVSMDGEERLDARLLP